MGAAALVSLSAAGAAFAADLQPDGQAPVPAVEALAFNWTGFYFGAHLGDAWGKSNWTASTAGAPSATVASGAFGLGRHVDTFDESGSWFEGFQTGYNYMFPNRFVIGAEADISFSAFPNPTSGLSTGGTSSLLSGPENYKENVFVSGTLRTRIGYAPGNWLYYAAGGLAWSGDQFSLTQASSAAESSFLWRLGWTAGCGVEGPLMPHWTARLEYLFKDYNAVSVSFPSAAQRFHPELSEQELRIGLNYRFSGDSSA